MTMKFAPLVILTLMVQNQTKITTETQRHREEAAGVEGDRLPDDLEDRSSRSRSPSTGCFAAAPGDAGRPAAGTNPDSASPCLRVSVVNLLGSPEFRPTADRPIGWRGDWTGRFPGAQPPTTWSRRVR